MRTTGMMNTLQVDPTTCEVFLRLPAPHENIVITPPRESDTDDLVLMLNDPRIYKFLFNPPFPYHPHHAEEWIRATRSKSDKLLKALREGEAVVDGFPVQYIREVQPDGKWLLLGDVSVARYGWCAVSDEELRAKMEKENSQKPVGDPDIVWTIGGVCHPKRSYANTGHTLRRDVPQTTSGPATTARGSCPQQSER